MENRNHIERLKKMELFGLKKDVKELNLRVLKQKTFTQRIDLGYFKFLLEKIIRTKQV